MLIISFFKSTDQRKELSKSSFLIGTWPKLFYSFPISRSNICLLSKYDCQLMTSPIKNILIEEEKAVLNCGYECLFKVTKADKICTGLTYETINYV